MICFRKLKDRQKILDTSLAARDEQIKGLSKKVKELGRLLCVDCTFSALRRNSACLPEAF
jgi:hypothetical protein